MKYSIIVGLVFLAGFIVLGLDQSGLDAQEAEPVKVKSAKLPKDKADSADANKNEADATELPLLKPEYYSYTETRIKRPKDDKAEDSPRRRRYRYRAESRVHLALDGDVDKKFGVMESFKFGEGFKIQIDGGENVFVQDPYRARYGSRRMRPRFEDDEPKAGRVQIPLDCPLPGRDAKNLDIQGPITVTFLQGIEKKTIKNVHLKAIGDVVFEDKANEIKITRKAVRARRGEKVDPKHISLEIEHKNRLLLDYDFVDDEGDRVGGYFAVPGDMSSSVSVTPRGEGKANFTFTYAKKRITQKFRLEFKDFKLP